MRICLLTADPGHPLLRDFAGVAGVRHRVEVIDPDAVSEPPSEDTIRRDPADVYLLKGHSAGALRLAAVAESAGARVLNSAAPTHFCQYRVRMAERARESGLPFPDSFTFGRLSGLVAYLENAYGPRFPLIVKSQESTRGDLVARVDDLAALRGLAPRWSREPVVVQKHMAGDGWDHKIWVVGDEVFVGLRRTPLERAATRATIQLDPADLPQGWLDLVRDVGKVYDLQVYGVDILATARGPMIVDVNAFPGCRGMRGAPEALAALVDRLVPSPAPALVPAAAATTAVRAPVPEPRVGPALLHDVARAAAADPHLSVMSLRRKPGQGLVARYRTASTSGRTGLTVSVPERVTAGSWDSRSALDGITVQAFPADGDLPGLAAALAPAASGLCAELAAAARTVTGDDDPSPVAIDVATVRYKPGSRCVVRYRLRTATRELTLFGKLYRRPEDAATAHHHATLLWDATRRAGRAALVPRPLALVAELGLVLTEAAGDATAVAGTVALRPGGPEARVAAAAAALAALHTCGVRGGLPERRSADHAARSRGWAAALAAHVPDLADELAPRAAALVAALEHAGAHRLLPVHGAFKPGQLVFCGRPEPVITDLDGIGLGDPASDVGYFLAYLRPAGFWRGRRGRRSWYDHNRTLFLDAYAGARGGAGPGLHGRAALYEAAALLKIASRRARRLQSPRPAEVAAVLAEIDSCLRRFAREGPTAR